MKKIFLSVIILIFSVSVLSAENIVTSIYPIYDIVKNIVQNNYNVFYVIPPGLNPHIYEPSPKSVLKLKKGDIFIGVSKEFDGWIEKFLKKNCKKVYLIQNKGINPHIWLSPSVMLKKIDFITATLCENDLKKCKKIKQNSITYKKILKKTFEELKKKTVAIKCKNIVQYHPAWNYFAKDFGFNLIGTLSREHGANISFKKFIELIEDSKKNHVKYVVTGFRTQNNILRNFANKINGKILYLDLFGNPSLSYVELIRKNINIFLTESHL